MSAAGGGSFLKELEVSRGLVDFKKLEVFRVQQRCNIEKRFKLKVLFIGVWIGRL